MAGIISARQVLTPSGWLADHAIHLDELGTIVEISPRGFDPATAVGTALDHFHGVDAFMIWHGIVVTIDVSLRDKHDFKADLLTSGQDVDALVADVVELFRRQDIGGAHA